MFIYALWANRQHFSYHFSDLKISLLILFLLGTGSIFWSANVGFFIGKWLL
ncbi:MAG: hypothetical protein Rsou_0259 [Candidatus Ruthia sp. Asou_11_S2]|nr:hypothetical protein [Candidatus Ruthia sp. Asou_11_S2]